MTPRHVRRRAPATGSGADPMHPPTRPYRLTEHPATMDERDVEAALRAILVKNAGIPLSSVADDQVLGRDLGFDSLAFVLTLADVEARLGVRIPPERGEELKDLTFRELVALVRRERAGR
jgi:acyl carrier protein